MESDCQTKGMVMKSLFVCDFERNRLTLGEVSNKKDCITIALYEGESLVFIFKKGRQQA